MELQEIKFYCFGSNEIVNSENFSGYCVFLIHSNGSDVLHEKYITGALNSTKWKAEMQGIIEALQALKKPSSVEIYTRDGNIADIINKGYRFKTHFEMEQPFYDASKSHKIKAIVSDKKDLPFYLKKAKNFAQAEKKKLINQTLI